MSQLAQFRIKPHKKRKAIREAARKDSDVVVKKVKVTGPVTKKPKAKKGK